ncbi:hypothetical protein G6F35_017476 [Rhizopus arrhizus]|uniref:Uncharacterized protein n=1 Tax=Rhizopus delemar TaxID=936053 RepID=A0A9P6XN93_9FUNG|nr:hypothetical protein G6F35_017476 [Rhizopus arrhizus]KAG1525722.1 hypothetical protein G6F50_018438 [Rhizopus delemar]
MADEGADEHQRAAATCQQCRQLRASSMEGGIQVGCHHLAPGIHREFRGRYTGAEHAGIVEGDVQAAE